MISINVLVSCLRALFTIELCFLVLIIAPLVCAVPHPILPSLSSLEHAADAPISESSPKAVTFAVPCPGCFNDTADAALPFELVHTSSTAQTISLHLNSHLIDIVFDEDNIAHATYSITAAHRNINLNIQGYCDYDEPGTDVASRHVLFFDIDPQDGTSIRPSFTALLDPSVHAHPLVIPHPTSEAECLSVTTELGIFAAQHETTLDASEHAISTSEVRHESSEDSPAKELRARFNDERQLIRKLTTDCHDMLSEKLKECKHDIKCCGGSICHWIHDVFLALVAKLKSSLQQSPMVSDERQWQAIIAGEKDATYGTVAGSPAPTISSSSASSKYHDKDIIMLALEILAGVLGLAGLCACIRHHFRSIRRRVDRLADREERKRAREYRSLARKEAMRKRWVAFRGIFRLPCRKRGCEEKASLILEAADPAVQEDGRIHDLEQAWDAALQGSPDSFLVHIEQAGRDYLASLAERPRVSDPEKASIGSSRSSILPSYQSEKLPDYASQTSGRVLVVGEARAYTPSITGCSATTVATPDSSIPDLSPRCSRETLRTMLSRD